MKVIYVVSPDYLEAILNESQKYSFAIQGYGDLDRACKGLCYVNVLDILGFGYVADTFPEPGSPLYDKFINFVSKCSLLGADKKFVLVTKETVPDIGGDLYRFSNLEFVSVVEKNGFTDITLNRNFFGSILLANYQPYNFNGEHEEAYHLSDCSCRVLKCPKVIPDFMLDILAPVSRLDSCASTIENDPVICRYVDSNEVVLSLRTIKIMRQLGADYESEKRDVLCSIEKMPEVLYGLYTSVLAMIEDNSYDN